MHIWICHLKKKLLCNIGVMCTDGQPFRDLFPFLTSFYFRSLWPSGAHFLTAAKTHWPKYMIISSPRFITRWKNNINWVDLLTGFKVLTHEQPRDKPTDVHQLGNRRVVNVRLTVLSFTLGILSLTLCFSWRKAKCAFSAFRLSGSFLS